MQAGGQSLSEKSWKTHYRVDALAPEYRFDMAKLDWYIRANLKPRHMQLLIALDDLRQVARVAGYLNVSQPAVSKTLAELEKGLGVVLFHRGPKGLSPTAYGQILIKLSRSVMRELDVTRDEMRLLASGADGRVRVGVLPTAAPVLAPRALIRLRQAAPRISVVLHEGTSDYLLPRLRQGDLDIVVGTLPSASKALGLEEQILHHGERIVVVCGDHHPLAQQPRVSCEDLKPFLVVLPPATSAFRVSVDAAMEALQLDASLGLIESGSMTATNTFLRESDAISFYSEHLAQHYSDKGLIHILPVDLSNLTAPVGMAWLALQERNPSLERFKECLVALSQEVFA